MTMIALLLALQAAAVPAPPVATWPSLPVFPLPRAASVGDAAARFVRSEVEAGRCAAAAAPADDGSRIVAPVAILVGASGAVRQIVPQAIGCSTVEQYTVGYVLALTRSGPGSAAAPQSGWYTLTVTYRW